MSEALRNSLDLWHSAMLYGSIAFFIVSITVIVVYYVRLAGKKELKDKYEFASLHEIKSYRTMHIICAMGVGMCLNTLKPERMERSFGLFFVRLSITAVAATIYGYVTSLVMKFYYPTRLSKKLNKLR